ncbi:MAG: hypothetical protein U5L96_05650 [Owenweeksia sp.]|nr:hypothetical protein [Owenweeksia sp.]
MSGNKTWVGYDHQAPTSHLPPLPDPVLKTTLGSGLNGTNDIAINHINQLYAKDYHVWNDFQFIMHGYRYLGQV